MRNSTWKGKKIVVLSFMESSVNVYDNKSNNI